MRSIETHKVGVLSDLGLFAIDEPGAGGANHLYVVEHGDLPSFLAVKFQTGPIVENSPNGVTNEVLLAIVIDRLASFQAGPFACDENQVALVSAQRALDRLLRRTKSRMARGVEGKLEA